VLVWLKRFKHFVNVTLLGIFGVVLLIAGDTTARIIGAVLIVLALGSIIYRRRRGFAHLFQKAAAARPKLAEGRSLTAWMSRRRSGRSPECMGLRSAR
jgi:uncharacterized membrane protein